MADITIFWERHANAFPKITTEVVSDHDAEMRRPLTPEGVRQAYNSGMATLQQERLRFTHLLASPAERAIQTLEYSACTFRDKFTIIESLWASGPDGDILNAIFEELGYAAPEDFAKHPLNAANRDKSGKGPVERFAWTSGLAIKHALFSGASADIRAAICGHAVFTPLAAKGLLQVLLGRGHDYPIYKRLDKVRMMPAGVFKMTFDSFAPEAAQLEFFN